MLHPLDILENVLATQGVAGVRRPLHIEAANQSVSNLVEFAAVRWSWWSTHRVDLAQVLPHAGETWSSLPAPGSAIILPFAADYAEVHDVPATLDAGWEPGDPFMAFQERFKTKLVKAAVPSAFAHGLLGAMNEMASNASEHSKAPIAPVAAYEIRDGRWSFCVTDVGAGILGSLQRHPKYATVADDVAAVRLAVQDGVTSTGRPGRGLGFTHVFRSLVNRMCRIRFRSTGAVATWEGTSPAAHQLSLTLSPPRAGFHVHFSGDLERP